MKQKLKQNNFLERLPRVFNIFDFIKKFAEFIFNKLNKFVQTETDNRVRNLRKRLNDQRTTMKDMISQMDRVVFGLDHR